MKVKVIKGPMFDKVEKEVYRYISSVLMRKAKERSLLSNPELDYNKENSRKTEGEHEKC